MELLALACASLTSCVALTDQSIYLAKPDDSPWGTETKQM